MALPARHRESAVLAHLRTAGRPLSAYDLLHLLRIEHPKLAAPTVYRLLARLAGNGLVQRVASLNAWIPRPGFCDGEVSLLTICDVCGRVDAHQAPGTVAHVRNTAAATGFRPELPMIEVHGCCTQCNDATGIPD